MPKSLSAPIVVNLHPTAAIGLTSLFQGESDIAEWTPAARVEEVRFGGFKRISSNVHCGNIGSIERIAHRPSILPGGLSYRFAFLSRRILVSRVRTAQYASRCLRRITSRSTNFFVLCFVPDGNWERSISIFIPHPYVSICMWSIPERIRDPPDTGGGHDCS